MAVTDSIYRLNVTLLNIEPPISRRIELAGSTSLDQFHNILQISFGWQNCHMHQFEKDEQRYGVVDGDDPFDADTLPEAKHTLGDVLPHKGDQLLYWYDFGDDWYHEIEVEDILTPDVKTRYPRVTAGTRRCPPEDCGGPFGYENLLAVLANKKHPEHRELRGWVGTGFNPEAFSLDDTNKQLARRRSLAAKP